MMQRLWPVLDVVVLVACIAGVAPAWHAGIESVPFAASGDLPAFEATRYSGPWLGLAALLVAVAGLALIDLIARSVRRARRA
ncbi:hypothetical protein [Nocardia macrotermitis]|uniref:Uncharacterized protein n=1 Tax=Nocardia macrotermitis TaxID=2585198 RepID=A0A7K0CXV5_9NOCA|nr:hypothetical protein [Nocardia macrotermitis]MQY18248.1 hypothetical protein [Nocardia macrotermitis]